jgi:hypothetical protein
LIDWAKLDPAVDSCQPDWCVAFAIDAEQNVGMRMAKLGESRGKPELNQISGGSNVEFLPTLQIKLTRDGAKLGEGALEVGQRCPEFRSRAKSGAAAHDKLDAEIIFECLDALSDGGGSQPEQFTSPFERSRPNREIKRLE